MSMKSSARGRAGPAALLLALLLAVLAWVYVSNRTRVVFAADSEFGGVRVTERADGLRRLYIGAGRAVQSAIYPGRPEHLEHAYTRVAMVAPALAPDSARILFVGLGGGAMPMFTRHALPGATIDVAEIDPVVVEAAHEWFAFRSDDRMRVHTGDGRTFIEQASPGTWDVIVLDAFSDDEIPLALATREFLVAVHGSLADDGVVASNLWTSNPLHAEMVATYLDVFENVVLIDVPRRRQQILLAVPARGALDRGAVIAAARRFDRAIQRPGFEPGFYLEPLVRDGYSTPASPAGVRILRDGNVAMSGNSCRRLDPHPSRCDPSVCVRSSLARCSAA